jgi:Leucine-rich repeat (LRR) protein
MVETQPPETYDVLRDAPLYLDYDASDGLLFLYGWRINSFDFLQEFENITRLNIAECYIPEGVRIPKTDALDAVSDISLQSIYGSGAADVLADCLPLPRLDTMYLSGGVQSASALPSVPSLTDLYVSVPNALEIIANNTHIMGALSFGVPYIDSVYEDIENIAGVEKFTNIQYLRPPHSVSDLSPVSGCAALRILDMSSNRAVDTLRPLYGLGNLEEIRMYDGAYDALAPEDRTRFNPENNSDANATHVYLSDEYDSIAESERLTLTEQPIDSFDFLLEYTDLKFLEIVECDIAGGLVLPKIDTLVELRVYDQNALEIVKNNTQLQKLTISTVSHLSDTPSTPLPDLRGLENFTSLEALTVEASSLGDMSALSHCANLRRLSLTYCKSISTLKPLYGLTRLRELYIDNKAFLSLPAKDQKRFDPTTGRKPYMISVEWRD